MKKMIALCLVLCAVLGLVGCGKNAAQATTAPAAQEQIDPNAIAAVELNGQKQYVYTVEELVAAVDASGNSQVTLLKNIDYNNTINLPYTCTIDFAGNTINTNPERGIGLIVTSAGSENVVTTLKNGNLNTYSECLRVKKGVACLENMNLHAQYGTCLTLHEPVEDQKTTITNCTLASAKQACISFMQSAADYSKSGVLIENTQLIAYNEEGNIVFHKAGDAIAGMIELGQGTTVYSFAKKVAPKEMLFNGSGMAKTVTEVTVGDQTITGITKWSEDTENQVIDVLMVGNSFCWYFVEELHGVADAAGVQLNVNNLYEAGCYVQEHWDWYQTDSAKYEQFWITNDFGRYKHPENLKLSAALAYDDWDIITLQQHYGTGVKDVEAALAKVVNADDLFDLFESKYPNATLYWQNTWAYQVGHEGMPSSADQKLRQNNINTVSQTVAERNGVDQIPAGQAWAIARANPAVGDTLCKSDMLHDGDVAGGQYLNACVWFEVLTGKSCIGNTWRPTDYHLDEAKIVELQKAAHQAVAEMYGADYAK